MQLTSISVTYRKQVSDGNYGTEAVEVTLIAQPNDEGEEVDSDLTVPALLADARHHVFLELDKSPSLNVRKALRAPKPATQAPAAQPANGEEDLPF